jgi:hypothetical protein
MNLNPLVTDFIGQNQLNEAVQRSRLVNICLNCLKVLLIISVIFIFVLKDLILYLFEENILEKIYVLYKSQFNLTLNSTLKSANTWQH